MNSEKSTTNNIFSITSKKAIIGAFIILICLQFVGGIISVPAFFKPELTHITLPLSFAVGSILAITILIQYFRIDFHYFKSWFKVFPSISVFILIVLLYVCSLPAAEFSANLIPTKGSAAIEKLYSALEESMLMMLNYKVASFITVCILAPIFEETLFRGILLRGLLNGGLSPLKAILLTSFLFGFAHLNPWQFVGAGILGIIFGYTMYRTKSLWLCIILHALHNTISYVTMINSNNIEDNVFESNQIYYVVIGLVLAVGLGIGINKATKAVKWN